MACALVSGSGWIAIGCIAMLGGTVHAVTVNSTIAMVQNTLPAKVFAASLCFTLGLKPGRLGLTLGCSSVSDCSESVPVCGVDTAVSGGECGSELSF